MGFLTKVLLVSAAVVMMSGCNLLAARYVDASQEPGVREIVSTSRTTNTELLLLGIDSYPGRNAIVYYKLTPFPGFDGPEVLSRSTLPQGTVLRVTGARRCTNCQSGHVDLSVTAEGIERKETIYISTQWLDLLE